MHQLSFLPTVFLLFTSIISFVIGQDISGCFGEPKNPHSKKPTCGGYGSLSNPNSNFEIGGLKFDDCSGRCGALKFRCKSLSFNKANGDCILYKDKLEDMGFTPSSQPSNLGKFYNKDCLNITCGPYCSFSPKRIPRKTSPEEIVVDGSFESDSSPWTVNFPSQISNDCNGGAYPYDGIRFALLNHSGNNGTQFLGQTSTYKNRTSYFFQYRYRVISFTPNTGVEDPYCTLEAIISYRYIGAIDIRATTDDFKLIGEEIHTKPVKQPHTLSMSLSCYGVDAQVSLDAISLVPVHPA